MKLIRRDGPYPPGGYPFTDGRTGFKFPGMEDTFYGQVRAIIRHRLANENLYPRNQPQFLSLDHVAAELDVYQCNRLGNNPSFCTDGTIQVKSGPATNNPCPACGTLMNARFCATCPSQKWIGWGCPKCGKTLDR